LEAATSNDASNLVNNLGERAIKMLGNKNFSDADKIDKFRELLNEGFDVPLIARYAIGKHWRRITPAKKQEYIKVFEDFIVSSYAARLGQFGGETFLITESRKDGKRDFIVSSIIKTSKGSVINVDWRVRSSSDQLRILDVIIEGVSMVITQRDEFSAIIQRSGGNVDNLIQKLKNFNKK
tara:strand:- start:456 stop:995 length:540 start_codon:yes stop_codon:yes gene_type:complete